MSALSLSLCRSLSSLDILYLILCSLRLYILCLPSCTFVSSLIPFLSGCRVKRSVQLSSPVFELSFSFDVFVVLSLFGAVSLSFVSFLFSSLSYVCVFSQDVVCCARPSSLDVVTLSVSSLILFSRFLCVRLLFPRSLFLSRFFSCLRLLGCRVKRSALFSGVRIGGQLLRTRCSDGTHEWGDMFCLIGVVSGEFVCFLLSFCLSAYLCVIYMGEREGEGGWEK